MLVADKSKRFTLISKNVLIALAISLAYLLLSFALIGFKPEQLVLAGLFFTLFVISPLTRNFITAFSIFIVYWIIFDYMKAFPNYRYNTVDIEGIYMLEKAFFGISSSGLRLTPNEFFHHHSTAFLDILSGLFYLCWIPVPLLMGVYLFFNNRKQFFYFALTFFTVNILGFIVYYLHPAAPPWYVQRYGFTFDALTPGNTAGLQRFDSLIGVPVFKSIYEKSSNVFAAMPSLHSAYPLIVLFYGIKNKLGYINILLGIIMAGIWFAAVYTSHHYLLDVLAGILCAITGITLFNYLAQNNTAVKQFITGMERLTRPSN